MTGSFILDYYLLVFLASCGVFQIVGAWKALTGMLLLKYRPGSFLLGLALFIASFTWFFLSEDRNMSDSAAGLNGNEQFAFFFAGLGTALAFTLLVSSLVNWGLRPERSSLRPGLEALKQSGYFHVLSQTWRPPGLKAATGPSGNAPTGLTPGRWGRLALRVKVVARLARQARRIGALR